MVYGIAQRHGALLEIDSEPGRGTTVRLRFSAAAMAQLAAHSIAS
jgi:signal transduction histidine kinase